MRKNLAALLSAAAFSVGAVSVASAADLPRKAAPMYEPAPAWTWTGFYLGVHGGAGWATTESSADVGGFIGALGLPIPPIGFILPTSSHNLNGFLAGGQVGYNWQTGPVVFGIEGNFSWSGIEGNTPCLVVLNCKTEVDWLADVSGRIGFVPMPNLLVYAKGGVAFGEFNYSYGNSLTIGAPVNATIGIDGSVSDTRIGYLFGMGAEYAFMRNWSAKVEYNYMDFGKETYAFPINVTPALVALPPINVEINNQIHTMKFGVNYRF